MEVVWAVKEEAQVEVWVATVTAVMVEVRVANNVLKLITIKN
jgi:hypothetical protein